eukprot:gene12765-9124_t
MISPLEGRRENSVKGPPSNRSLSTTKRRSSSSRSTNSSSSANTNTNRNNSRHSLSDNAEDRQASDKSVGSMKTEKVTVPQEDIRSVCRWIQFFCGSTDGKVCISEVEELILYPPFLHLDERYEVSGPMLSFQGMLQRCGMNPQEWYEFVMRHDPVFSKTPVMMLPTFTKAMIKMCNEVSVSMMSDAQIRVLYRYFVGSYTTTFGNAPSSPDVAKGSPALVVEEAQRPSTDFLCFNYVDEGFSAFDFAIAFAKHSVQDTDVIASYNQIAQFVHQWGTYLKETHMDLTVIGGITSKSMKTGILTVAELEKVLSNLYVKHQQYLRQMSRPGMNSLACASSSSTSNPLSMSSSASAKQQPRDVSTLGAAEDELLPENDETPVAIPQRKRSMLNSVVDLLQNVRASFALTIPSTAKVVPIAGATGSPSNQSAASTAQSSALGSRTSRKGQRRAVSSAKGKASVFPVHSGHSSATTVYSDSQYTAGEEFTALHDIGVADMDDEAAVRAKKCCAIDEEERAERRRRRSVKHPLRYSALFTAEAVTPAVSATTSEGTGN